MAYRDHEPVVIDQFNGLYDRGDVEDVPMDHFTGCNNIRFPGEKSFSTRYGIGISQEVAVPLSNVKRIYNYPMNTGNTLIVLTVDPVTGEGKVYHVVSRILTYGPILTIDGMEDIAFQAYGGRAYISPFSTLGEFTTNPQSSLSLVLDAGAGVTAGLHKYAYTFVTSTGETSPSALASTTTVATLANPLAIPIITQGITAPFNSLVNGGVYKWLFTYSRDGITETLAGTPSAPYTNDSTKFVLLQSDIAFPAEVTHIGIYRTVAGGSTYYRVGMPFTPGNTLLPVAGVPTVASGNFINIGYPDDGSVISNPQAPVSNNTQFQQVKVNNIGIGPAPTTGRNVYRTEAGLDQLKLLTVIADNTDTNFQDNIADGALGANAPTVNTATVTGSNLVQKGLDNEFVYVYFGDGVAARKAAGSPLVGNMTIAHGAAGHTDAGVHIFGIVAETTSGYLTPPGALEQFTTAALNSVSFGNVPTGGSTIAKRHLVATRRITGFNGNLQGYTFYFVPNATIENNTDTFLNNISFYDADLLDDASHLLDNYSEIPAGAVLSTYRDRLLVGATFDNISIILVSESGEPEAISQIDGILTVPPDGYAITNAQELRDILYVTKLSRTDSFNDNGDIPSSWARVGIDDALGTGVHGIANVLNKGAASIDFLIIATYQGISIFNGRYIIPELSFKIEHYWQGLNRTLWHQIQVMNATIQKELYVVLPNRSLLVGNYSNGFDPRKIRWAPQTFPMGINCLAITNIDQIIIGADIF